MRKMDNSLFHIVWLGPKWICTAVVHLLLPSFEHQSTSLLMFKFPQKILWRAGLKNFKVFQLFEYIIFKEYLVILRVVICYSVYRNFLEVFHAFWIIYYLFCRWHTWLFSCSLHTLCWWRWNQDQVCRSGLLLFIFSALPLKKSER